MSKIETFNEKDGVIFFKEKPLDGGFVWSPLSFENDDLLYETFGVLLEEEYQRDSIEYKKRLEGICYAFTKGPTLEAIELCLNLLSGAPVNLPRFTIVEGMDINGDVLVRDETGTITTLPLGNFPPAFKIKQGYRLFPYEPLSSSIEILDEIKTPRWWLKYNVHLLPDYLIVLEEGQTVTSLSDEQKRLINEVVKNNCFGIKIPAQLLGSRSKEMLDDITRIVEKVKPVWTRAIAFTFVYLGGDGSDPFVSETNFEISDSIQMEFKIYSKEEEDLVVDTANIFAASLSDHRHNHGDLLNIQGVEEGERAYHLSFDDHYFLLGEAQFYHSLLVELLGIDGEPVEDREAFHLDERSYNFFSK